MGQTISGRLHEQLDAQANRYSLNCISLDPSVLINRDTPNTLFVANYNGVLDRTRRSRRCSTRRRSSGSRRRRHQHRGQRLAVPDARRRHRARPPVCSTRRRSSARSIPKIATTISSPAACPTRCRRRKPARTISRAAASTTGARAPAATRRARPTTCSSRTTCRPTASRSTTRAACRFRCSRPASRASRTGCRRSAPSSTSTPRRSTSRITGSRRRVSARSRHALRGGAQQRDRRHHHRRHDDVGAAPGFDLRPRRQRPHGAAGDLRTLRRQVQRSAVRREYRRRQPEPGDLRLHRTGRTGTRLRTGHEPGELHDDHQRLVPDREHLRRRRPAFADGA